VWTVQDAKAKLSEVLDRARSGEAQIIGARDPCVVVSMDEYRRLKRREAEPHRGRWLVETLRGLGEIELPSRADSRPVPFADWPDEDARD
jgi:prevent-host-death family protein